MLSNNSVGLPFGGPSGELYPQQAVLMMLTTICAMEPGPRVIPSFLILLAIGYTYMLVPKSSDVESADSVFSF